MTFRPPLAVFVLLLACIAPAAAQERILSFGSVVAIAPDGSIDVTETIAVHAEGTNIRRGIYRDFPTRYTDRRGQRFVVDFDVISLQRDGVPEPWFTENVNNGVRVNFGSDDFLAVPNDYTYTLRYRTTRQVGFFDDHDELYWNATGHGWDFTIERASATLKLPVAVPAAELRTDEYTGVVGSSASAASVDTANGEATWTTTRALAPSEGMTVVLGFPKGIIAPPTDAEKLRWLIRDLAGPVVALVGLLMLLGGYLIVWARIGRDPRAGTIIPQYDPPEGHSPAGLRYVRKQAYDQSAFTADVVALGVAGLLRIERTEKSGMFSKDQWAIEAQASNGARTAALAPPPLALLAGLFSAGVQRVELKTENASTLQAARRAHSQALAAQYKPRYFKLNWIWLAAGFAFTGAIALATVVLESGSGFAILSAVAFVFLAVIIQIVFAFLLPQRTAEGRALLDRIEGLRMYLDVAERDELAKVGVPEPAIDADRYQRLLPYAMALDVESAWTKRFTEAVGAAEAQRAASSAPWLVGSAFNNASFSQVSQSLGREMSQQIASSSTPPGSSSGGGGGGFSGGGGGGGGGGGR